MKATHCAWLFVIASFPRTSFSQESLQLKSEESCVSEYKNLILGDSHLNLLVSVLDEKVTKHYGDEKIPKDRRPQIIHSPDDSELILYFFPPQADAKPEISIFSRSDLDRVLKAAISCAEFIVEMNHPSTSGDGTVRMAGVSGFAGRVPKMWVSKEIMSGFKDTSNWDIIFEALKKIQKAGTFVSSDQATGVKEVAANAVGLSKSGKKYRYELKFFKGPMKTYRFLGNLSTWKRKSKSGKMIVDTIIHFTEVVRK